MRTIEIKTIELQRTEQSNNLKKFVFICLLTLFFTLGCSLLPRVTFQKANSVPQSTKKEERFIRCKGKIILNELGQPTSCDSYFESNQKLFNQEERKHTWKERIINFLSSLVGWSFWIFIGLLILAPGLAGTIVGGIFTRLFGGTTKALQATISGISKAKKNAVNLPPEERELYKRHVELFMSEIGKEHDKDPEIKKIVNEFRAKA